MKRVCREMVVSGGGFWSSWCSGWTHSVWLQTDIFDSFRELFVNNYRWLLLLSTVSVILIDQLPAASIAPSRGPWRSSRTDRSLFTRSRYTRSGPVPQNETFECVSLWTLRTWVIKLLITNNELMNKIIDVLTLHHLWLSSCCSDL